MYTVQYTVQNTVHIYILYIYILMISVSGYAGGK